MPLLVKLAPDLDDAELDGALEAILGCGMDGVIQGNTTLSRARAYRRPTPARPAASAAARLQPLALAALRRTVARLEGRLPVIASGGVMDPAGARARLDAGAVLVQLYTGLIYNGPGLVKEILDTLSEIFGEWIRSFSRLAIKVKLGIFPVRAVLTARTGKIPQFYFIASVAMNKNRSAAAWISTAPQMLLNFKIT